jgi:5-methyltetrahydropteroyltriglutamate--homocysteine methyltransferase
MTFNDVLRFIFEYTLRSAPRFEPVQISFGENSSCSAPPLPQQQQQISRVRGTGRVPIPCEPVSTASDFVFVAGADEAFTFPRKRFAGFKTTHVGSLPRPAGRAPTTDEGRWQAMNEVVRRQLSIGVDVINDGEASRKDYVSSVLNRMTGFVGNDCDAPMPSDLEELPETTKRFMSKNGLMTLNKKIVSRNPACIAPISYTGTADFELELDDYVECLHRTGAKTTSCFYTAPSPGTLAIFFENKFYATQQQYLDALGTAMAHEYRAVIKRGLILQVDCPDMAMGRHTSYKNMSERQFVTQLKKHVDVLNKALEGLPAEQIRMHLCWGNYSGSHHNDIALSKILHTVLQAKPQTMLIESCNNRHRHEYRCFETATIPEGKIIAAGVLDTCSFHVEHPCEIAERITKFADILGPENVMACTDCGFATTANSTSIPAEVAWMKMRAMVAGTQLANHKYFGTPTFVPRPVLRVIEFGTEPTFDALEMPQAEFRFVRTELKSGFSAPQLATHLRTLVDLPVTFVATNEHAVEDAKSVVAELIKDGRDSPAVPIKTYELCEEVQKALVSACLLEQCTDTLSVAALSPGLSRTNTPKDVYDVIIVGAGLTGLSAARTLQKDGVNVAVFEKQSHIGGIWHTYANDTSQVNSSEASYRVSRAKGGKVNRDHSTTKQIMSDAHRIAAELGDALFTSTPVHHVEKVLSGDGDQTYVVDIGNGVTVHAKGVLFAINDRVGVPRAVVWPKQEIFSGKIVNGFGNETKGLDWTGKRVVIVGMGAFAIENVRTALEAGASHCTVISRRHGTVCPKFIDYVNFVNKTGEEEDLSAAGMSTSNIKNMLQWRKLYEASGATMPECWMDNIKHAGHTISVSDIWFIAHYLGMLDTYADTIAEFVADGVKLEGGQVLKADIVVRCTGFERNASLIPKLSKYTSTNSINYLDQNCMYLADAFIDDDVFNSMFGSSVMEMAKFFTSVYSFFFRNPEKYQALMESSECHSVEITNRNWSDYIQGADAIIKMFPEVKKIAATQLMNRHNDFVSTHTIPEYIQANKREWEDTHDLLSQGSEGDTLQRLPYPQWL